MMGGVIGVLFIHPLDVSIEVDTKDPSERFLWPVSVKKKQLFSPVNYPRAHTNLLKRQKKYMPEAFWQIQKATSRTFRIV
jgi:hypothetical protein